MNTVPPQLLTAATDAAALVRLRALPPREADALLDTLDALPTPEARQDHLIGAHRLALSLPALAEWTREARTARDERRFGEFLDDVRRAAERAEAFRELLARAERLHQVNVALLAARLFDALVARDGAVIETFAHTFAEVVAGCGMRDEGWRDPSRGCHPERSATESKDLPAGGSQTWQGRPAFPLSAVVPPAAEAPSTPLHSAQDDRV